MKNTSKVLLVFLFLSCLLVIRPTASYAYWHGGHSYVGVNIGVWPGAYYGGPYYHYYDPYYDPYYVQPTYVVAPSYVAASSSYQPVVVNGVTYYLNNGVYYTYTQYGYQAVSTPVGVSAPEVQTATVTAAPVSAEADDSITINVPNKQGGYTAVILKKSGTGFTGPQGEFYAEFPKVSQLQLMYGK